MTAYAPYGARAKNYSIRDEGDYRLMPVKYQCPKCGRRFAEWGAEKLGFTCPADENCPEDAAEEQIELVRMGINDDRLPTKKSAPKRLVRRPLASAEEMSEMSAAEDSADFDGGDDDDVIDVDDGGDDEPEEEEVMKGSKSSEEEE